MADALTVPHAVAALVLCVAGLAKLRAPAAAARAVNVKPALIRAFAVFETGLGAWALVKPTAVTAALLALTYCGFAVLTLLLSRRDAACGCFGSERAVASPIQSLLSVALAGVVAVSAVASPHALGWILGRPTGIASVLLLGTAAAVYATVLAYSELPLVWRAWSPA